MNLDDVRVGLAFDDVLLVPRRSAVRSRHDVSVATQLSRNVALGVPIVAANMDTVCESEMALALGHLGGIGIVHRFFTIEQQAAQIRKVKGEGVQVGAAIGTDHDTVDYALVARHAHIVVDTRNAMKRVISPRARVVKA